MKMGNAILFILCLHILLFNMSCHEAEKEVYKQYLPDGKIVTLVVNQNKGKVTVVSSKYDIDANEYRILNTSQVDAIVKTYSLYVTYSKSDTKDGDDSRIWQKIIKEPEKDYVEHDLRILNVQMDGSKIIILYSDYLGIYIAKVNVDDKSKTEIYIKRESNALGPRLVNGKIIDMGKYVLLEYSSEKELWEIHDTTAKLVTNESIDNK